MKREYHGFEPFLRPDSRVLILGSFPSVKSREESFYYAHPRNRFWTVLADLFGEPVPATLDEKKSLLERNHIALWDVCESCLIEGSGDNTIREVEPVDIRRVFEETEVTRIFCNGSTAWALYMEFLYPITDLEAVKLPSTSPANAAKSLEMLEKKWREEIRN